MRRSVALIGIRLVSAIAQKRWGRRWGNEKKKLTGFGCVVILTRDVEFDSDSVGGFGYVCYRIEGLISTFLLLRGRMHGWKGKWGQEDGGLCTGYFVREDGVENFTFLDLLLLTHISIFLLSEGRWPIE